MGANVSTLTKQAYLETMLDAAVESGEPLLDLLKSARKCRVESATRGKVLTATAGNGHEASFQIPDDLTVNDALELAQEMVNRYREAKTALADDDNDSPTDTEIEDEMLDKLQPVRSIASDYTNLRCEPAEITL